MQPADLARALWEHSQTLSAPPNSTGWWIEIAERAQDLCAQGMVEDRLGGTEVSGSETRTVAEQLRQDEIGLTHSPIAPPDGGIGPRSAAHRTICSQRALLDRPVPLDRRFRPSYYGYSGEDFQRDYPYADPKDTLEKFFSHHIDKGDTHRNWLEKFWSYALMANRIAKEQAADKTSTDSMGQPLDPAERARRLRVAREHERQNNEYIDQQIAQQNEREQA